MKIRDLLNEDGSDRMSELSIKLSAILNQIASRVADTGANKPMSVTSLVKLLNNSGLPVTVRKLKDMVDDEDPLVANTIARIEGDDVTFIGQSAEQSGAMDVDQTTGTLEKMAKRATSKRD